jgi:hypothetical protein
MVTRDSGKAGSGEACEAREANVDIRHVGIGNHVGTETQIETNVELFRIPIPSAHPFDITSWLWKLSPLRHISALSSWLSAPWNNQLKVTAQLPYRGMVIWLDPSYNGRFHHNALFLRGIIFGARRDAH